MMNWISSRLTWLSALLIYSGYLLLLLPLAKLFGSRRRLQPSSANDRRVLVIGTFYTRNWCIAHLRPIAAADNVREVLVVADGPTQPLPHVRYIQPNQFLLRACGRAIAKFAAALAVARRERPELIIGYHLLPNALSALLAARLTGAQAGYSLTAGPIELIGGGAATENFFLRRLRRDSRVLELLAFRIARQFDLVVARGCKGRRFLAQCRLGRRVRIIPGSIDCRRLVGDNGGRDAAPREIDIITVCRLVEIKQPRHMLRVFERLRDFVPLFRAVMLGEGPLRELLQAEVQRRGLAAHLEFAGHQDDVAAYLRRAKIFLLTSRSEGLSIAMAEAMAAGAVPVVADVGELSDLVRPGETGCLIPPGDFIAYARAIADLLRDPEKLARFSKAAQAAARSHNDVAAVAACWADVLAELDEAPAPASTSPRALLHAGIRRKLWQGTPQPVKDALAPLTQRLPQARLLGHDFRRALQFVQDSEHWSHEQAEAYQLAQTQRLVHHAYEHSQYYHDAFRAAGFHPRDLRSLDDVAGLPCLTANTVRTHLEDLTTLPSHAPGVDFVSTGGSGGRPLHFLMNTDRSAAEYAYLVSSWRRAGFRLGMTQAVLRGEVVSQNGAGCRHSYDPLLRRHYYSSYHLDEHETRRYLKHIRTIGPCYLHVYPSTVAALARFIVRSQQPVPANIRGILAGSENVYPEERAFVERTFGARYMSWYGQSEKVVLAAECESSTDYHVWPAYGYFELLDEAGRAITQPGQTGEIVGTGFINTVVPFIRYRTGDFATYVGDRCAACGRQHPIIRDVVGHRAREYLVSHDGALIPWTALNMHDDTFLNVRQFQFRQEQPGRAVLQLVPAPGFDQQAQARLLERLAHKTRGRVDLQLTIAEKIPVSPRGKAIYIDQRLDLNELQQSENGS